MNARRSALRSFQELIFGGHSLAAPGKAHAEFRPPDLLCRSSALSTRSVTRMVVPSGPEHPLDATRERSPFGPAFDSGAHLRRTFPGRTRHGTCRVSAPRSAALTICALDTQLHALLGSSFQLHPDLHRRPLSPFREPIFGHRAPKLLAWAHAGFERLCPSGAICTLGFVSPRATRSTVSGAGESPPSSREAGTFRTMRSDHAFRTMGESEGPTPLHLPSIDRSPKAIRPFLICAWSYGPKRSIDPALESNTLG